jgi:hypothetical protein
MFVCMLCHGYALFSWKDITINLLLHIYIDQLMRIDVFLRVRVPHKQYCHIII